MALTVGVLTMMVRISNSETLPDRVSRGPIREGLTLYSETAVRIYEHEGLQALEDFIRRSQSESGTEVFLLDTDGNPISSTIPDGNAANVVRELMANPQEQPPHVFSLFAGVNRSTWGRVVVSPSGKHYIFAARFRTPGGPTPLFDYSRIAVSILIGGVLCCLLGLYLTRPLKKLQSTVKEFADGNLEARVGPEIERRRDELADLGREFDHMAERIAALISSEK